MPAQTFLHVGVRGRSRCRSSVAHGGRHRDGGVDRGAVRQRTRADAADAELTQLDQAQARHDQHVQRDRDLPSEDVQVRGGECARDEGDEDPAGARVDVGEAYPFMDIITKPRIPS